MADAKKDQEPSIEEILESIRRIISDEDEFAEPLPEEAGDILDLDLAERVDGGPAVAVADAVPVADEAPIAVPDEAPIEPLPPPAEEPPPEPLPPEPVTEQPPETINPPTTMDAPMTDDQNSLISAQTAEAATGELSKLLANNVAIERADVPSRIGQVTLEEMALELMKPLIKTWLDQNLPGIVEKVVQREVEKLSHRVTDR